MRNYIYLLEVEKLGVYKIGFTNEKNTPSGRIKELQTGCPYKISVAAKYLSEYGKNIERMLHRQYAFKKVDEDLIELQGEWFDLSSDDVNGFEENCAKAEENILFIIENSTFKNPLKYL